MIPTIGIMIGAYIVQRMLEKMTDDSADYVIRCAAFITALVAIGGAGSLAWTALRA